MNLIVLVTDPNTESRLPILLSINTYVPRDERFGHLKMSDALSYALKAVSQILKPELDALFDSTPNEFDSLDEIFKLYEGSFEIPRSFLDSVRNFVPAELLKEIFRTDGEKLLKFPTPQVIKGNEYIASLFYSLTNEIRVPSDWSALVNRG